MASTGDKTIILNDSDPDETESLNHQQTISLLRKYLLILIYLQWFMCLLVLGYGIYSVTILQTLDVSSALKSLFPIILATALYTLGLLATYRRHRTGLLVFVWIGVLFYIITFLTMILILLAIIGLGTAFGSSTEAYQVSIILAVVFLIKSIVIITTIRFAFNLARLLKAKDYLPA